jgi:hypothetical protein
MIFMLSSHNSSIPTIELERIKLLPEDGCLLECCAIIITNVSEELTASNMTTISSPGWWWQKSPLKRRWLSATLHGVTSQKTVIVIQVAMGTRNLTKLHSLQWMSLFVCIAVLWYIWAWLKLAFTNSECRGNNRTKEPELLCYACC